MSVENLNSVDDSNLIDESNVIAEFEEDVGGKYWLELLVRMRRIGNSILMEPEDDATQYPPIVYRRDETVFKTNMVYCQKCLSVLTHSGGHLKRHSGSKLCNTIAHIRFLENSARGLPNKNDISTFFATFVISSGLAMNFVESDAFRTLATELLTRGDISDPEEIRDLLPCRQTVTKTMLELLEDMKRVLAKMISPIIEDKMLSLMSDFGKVHVDFLVLKGSYIIETDDLIWRLKVIPLAVHPIEKATKDYIFIKEEIEKIMDNLKVPRKHLSDCTFSADGAANMKKAGNLVFSSYIRCTSHLSSLYAQHMFENYATYKPSKEDAEVLKFCKDLIVKCSKLAEKVKQDPKISALMTGEIVTSVSTRWLTNYRCVYGIRNNLTTITNQKYLFDKDGDKIVMELNSCEQVEMMDIIIESLEKIYDFNTHSQKNEPLIHTVIPVISGLIKFFENRTRSSDIRIQALAKSALHAIKYTLEDLSDYYCLGYYLNPMRPSNCQENFDILRAGFNIKRKAEICLRENAIILGLDSDLIGDKDDDDADKDDDEPVVKKSKKSFIESCMSEETDKSDDTMTVGDEYKLFLASKYNCQFDSFWPRNKNVFPKLYQIAKRIFGICPSESSAERTFSYVKNVFTVNRKSIHLKTLENLLIAYEINKV